MTVSSRKSTNGCCVEYSKDSIYVKQASETVMSDLICCCIFPI